MNYPYEETGKRIFKLRKERGLTREHLAEMADISVQFLADIEKGRKNMTVTTLRKLSSALMVSTDYIVNGSKDPDASEDEDVLFLYCRRPGWSAYSAPYPVPAKCPAHSVSVSRGQCSPPPVPAV